ncbi:chorismate-binding protein [Jatrophihabitans telluris]|uniref:Chorismate-binding protein n=1 Tax=Jatrophihabitans telluris TaxID=2038343 RepID=A0ABY4R023_9ACTN|nr:chorismate-binding protein [Jatrophihabitans telluris]UQX89123.1 chorismate-binding protein [Jatrophihabitans telluris]
MADERGASGPALSAGLAQVLGLAKALSASTQADTSELALLTGRWPAGRAILAWHPSGHVADPAAARGPGWIGVHRYSQGAVPEDRGPSGFTRFDRILRLGPATSVRAGGRPGAGQRAPEALTLWTRNPADADAVGRLVGALAEQAADGQVGPSASEVRITAVEGGAEYAHLAAVEHAIRAIRAGSLYQVNICTRLFGELAGSPFDLFAAGVTTLDPDYACFLQTEGGSVVSLSPELFLARDHTSSVDVVVSGPIKGTRRRGDTMDPTEPAAQELLASDKDRAENIMITDLVRNDLSRVARAGSVTVPTLLELRPAPGVWHLVSEVRAELDAGVTDADLIGAAFPPGSVTGAPKSAAVRLIDQLEDRERGAFTGALGYLGIEAGTALNVAIRTFEFASPGGGRFALGVGGGITASSVPTLEWRECLVKAAPLLALGGYRLDVPTSEIPAGVNPDEGVFDTLLAVDGVPMAAADHLARLAESSEEVFGRRLPSETADRVRRAAAATTGRQRIRLSVRADVAEPSITLTPAAPPPDEVRLRLITGRSGAWRHKWNDRRYLAALERQCAPSWPAFLNADNALLETSRSNLAAVTGGPDAAKGYPNWTLRTPVASERILPGITRLRLLDVAGDLGWRIEFGDLALDELRDARLVLSLSSTGLLPVSGLDGADAVDFGLDRELLAELRDLLGL